MENNQLTDNEFRQLREYIEINCGISLGDEKAYLVESRLAKLLTETGSASFGELCNKAKADPTLGLRDKIVDAMTTNETLWFRDSAPFQILEQVLLKQMDKEMETGRRQKIRIWSAACSTGQEPYSIAMTLQEFARKYSVRPLQNVEIIATDISPTVLFLAMAGRYDQIAISRGLSEDVRNRYFNPNGKIWTLNDKIKKMVKFKKLNLQENLGILGNFDIIFCRYVTIYFSDAFKRDLFSRISALLKPNGHLLLGASESLGNYSTEYQMLTHDGHIYYQVK